MHSRGHNVLQWSKMCGRIGVGHWQTKIVRCVKPILQLDTKCSMDGGKCQCFAALTGAYQLALWFCPSNSNSVCLQYQRCMDILASFHSITLHGFTAHRIRGSAAWHTRISQFPTNFDQNRLSLATSIGWHSDSSGMEWQFARQSTEKRIIIIKAKPTDWFQLKFDGLNEIIGIIYENAARCVTCFGNVFSQCEFFLKNDNRQKPLKYGPVYAVEHYFLW